MTKPKMKTQSNDELLSLELERDPQFRREWERLEFARLVAAKVIEYRAENNLTQRALASELGIPQSQIARLENAEHQPSYETLARLTTLGMEFVISFQPRRPKKRPHPKKVSLSINTTDTTIHYTAA